LLTLCGLRLRGRIVLVVTSPPYGVHPRPRLHPGRDRSKVRKIHHQHGGPRRERRQEGHLYQQAIERQAELEVEYPFNGAELEDLERSKPAVGYGDLGLLDRHKARPRLLITSPRRRSVSSIAGRPTAPT
jgi:hypothetical protein